MNHQHDTVRTPDLATLRLAMRVLFFAMGSVFGSWASRIPDVKRALNLSDGALGLALFAGPAGEFCAVAVTALVIRRIGSKAVMVMGLPLYGATLALVGAASSFAWLALALFGFGFACNYYNIALNAQAVAVEVMHGRPVMSSFHGMWSLGGVAGGIAGSAAASLGVPPAWHFLAAAAAATAAALLLSGRILQQDPPRKTQGQASRRRGRLASPGAFILLLGFIAFANMATEGTMYDWSAVYFAQVVQPAEHLVRAGFVACMCAMVTGRFLGDRLVARFGPVRVLQAGGVFVACGIVLACLRPSVLWSTAGFALVGLGMSPAIPLCYSLTAKSRRVEPSVGISLISTIGFFGILCSPALTGFLAECFGLRSALLPLAAMGAGIVVLAPLLPKAEACQEDAKRTAER